MVPLTLVAIRALFGIKLIGRDAEDIVALNAHAVKDGADDRTRLTHGLHSRPMLVDGSARGKLGGHGRILARGNVQRKQD